MPKGYWIARVDVHDPERYKDYVAGARAAFEAHNARFLARGGVYDGVEGTARARNVIIEFESLEIARACYRSADYRRAASIRQECATAEIVLVEGAV